MKPTRRSRVSHLFAFFLLSALWLVAGAACATDSDDAAEATQETTADEASTEPFDVDAMPPVVATVGDEEISRDQLLTEARGARNALLQSGVPAEQTETEAFYRQALDQIIAGMLLYDEAQAEGLVPPQEQIDQQIATLRQQVPEGQTFESLLASRGTDEAQLREELRMNAALQRIVDTKIAPQVKVSEEDARAFYDENLARMQVPPRVKVRHILLKAPAAEEGNKAEVRKKAEDLRARIAGGADFAALARQHSEDQVSQDNGGELPWILQGQTVPEFEQAAFALGPGELSPVVESQYGFHIIEGVERQEATTAPFDQVRPRIMARLQDTAAREQLHAHVDQLKTKTPVTIRLSEEPAS